MPDKEADAQHPQLFWQSVQWHSQPFDSPYPPLGDAEHATVTRSCAKTGSEDKGKTRLTGLKGTFQVDGHECDEQMRKSPTLSHDVYGDFIRGRRHELHRCSQEPTVTLPSIYFMPSYSSPSLLLPVRKLGSQRTHRADTGPPPPPCGPGSQPRTAAARQAAAHLRSTRAGHTCPTPPPITRRRT